MRRALILTVASGLACLALVAVAVAQENAQEAPAAIRETGAARTLTPADEARRAKVIAKVGSATITIGTVEDAVNEQSPFIRARYRDPAELRSFVEGLIRFELLARAAERANLDEHAEVRDVVKQNVVQQLIRRDFDERFTPETVPEADVRAYYQAHPEEFGRAELRRAAHIQVASRDEAQRLLTKVRGADARQLRDLAREHSLDPETRLRGGDLRYFDRQGRARNARDPQVDEALATAAFRLTAVGDVAAEPIQVGERWSVLQLTGIRPAEHDSLEQATAAIRMRLWRERRQAALEEFVTGLRERANVQPNYDLLAPIRLDPPTREDAPTEGGHGADPSGGGQPPTGT